MTELNQISGLLMHKYDSLLSDKYEIVYEIASGSFGDVIQVKDLETNEMKAVKCMNLIDVDNEDNLDDVIRKLSKEAGLMFNLYHRNIVKFYDYFQFANYFCVVLEYCEEDLTRLLQRYYRDGIRPSKELMIEWFYKLSHGLKYLHDKQIIHRDIKPSNILFKGNEIKIADFGESRQLLQTFKSQTMTICGTPFYMAPELFDGETCNYSFKSDVWSLGCVFYEIYYLEQAFDGADFIEVKANVLNRTLKHSSNGTNEITKLINRMIRIDVSERPSIEDVLSDDMFTNYLNGEFSRDHTNLNVGNIYVNISMHHATDKTVRLQVEPTNTVENVKTMISKQESIPVDRQILIFNGQQLQDQHKLSDYKIEKEALLWLVRRSTNKMFIKYLTGETTTLNFEPTDKIKDVKVKIEKKEGLPIDRQKLIFAGRILEDQNTLSYYNVSNRSILHLVNRYSDREANVCIKLLSRDETIKIKFEPTNTIKDVKSMIQDKEGFPINKQVLIFAGRRLEDKNTLSQYNIEKDAILHLVIKTH